MLPPLPVPRMAPSTIDQALGLYSQPSKVLPSKMTRSFSSANEERIGGAEAETTFELPGVTSARVAPCVRSQFRLYVLPDLTVTQSRLISWFVSAILEISISPQFLIGSCKRHQPVVFLPSMPSSSEG